MTAMMIMATSASCALTGIAFPISSLTVIRWI